MITEKEYRYCLCNVPGFGAKKISELLRYFGSAEAVWKCNEASLMAAMEQISEERSIFRISDVEQICNAGSYLNLTIEKYHKLKERGIRFITPQDLIYPERLKSLYDMPQGLYVIGTVPKHDKPSAAIVGARNCSHYGEEMASALARELCSRGVDIISGMALGIDGAAHRAVLGEIQARKADKSGVELGATYAILGCGVDVCYPRTNMDIYRQLIYSYEYSCTQQEVERYDGKKSFEYESGSCHMRENSSAMGGVLSEFPPGTQPMASNFPMRNRIISGLADIVIVVEARFRSGSLITADQALEQGRDVYAVPGRVTDPLSRGCNELIGQGAGIICDPVEFAEKLFPERNNYASKRKKNKIALALSEEKVYSCLDFSPTHLSTIVRLTGFSAKDTVSILIQLQMKNLIMETSKNYYALKFR